MKNPLGIKASTINKDSPYAERILMLSEIDSMWQNGEIDKDTAYRMLLALKDHRILLAIACRK